MFFWYSQKLNYSVIFVNHRQKLWGKKKISPAILLDTLSKQLSAH